MPRTNSSESGDCSNFSESGGEKEKEGAASGGGDGIAVGDGGGSTIRVSGDGAVTAVPAP